MTFTPTKAFNSAFARFACAMLRPMVSVGRPHGMKQGRTVAYMRAASRILSAGTHVISATFSGG